MLRSPCRPRGWLPARLTLGRRILTHVDNVLYAVVDVPLTCFQGGGVHLADHGLGKSPVSLIDHEVSRGRLLAPENLALQHLLSIPQYWRGKLALRMR